MLLRPRTSDSLQYRKECNDSFELSGFGLYRPYGDMPHCSIAHGAKDLNERLTSVLQPQWKDLFFLHNPAIDHVQFFQH